MVHFIFAYSKGKEVGYLRYNSTVKAVNVYKIFNAEKYNNGFSGNGTEVIYTSNFIKNALIKAELTNDKMLIEFLRKAEKTNDMITIIWR